MTSIVSQIVVVLVNRESDGSVNWPCVRNRNHPQIMLAITIEVFVNNTNLTFLSFLYKISIKVS